MPDNSKDTRTMIATPIAQLLRSRKTIVALATALANILVLALPSLEPVRAELVTILTVLGTVLIASISHEDAAAKSAPTTIATGSGDVAVNQPPPNVTTPSAGGSGTG